MSANSTNNIITASQLSIGYIDKKKETCIASNLNFSIQKNELIALVGVNGSGKSTLLKTLANILPNLNGAMYLNGIDINTYSDIDLAQNMSLVLTHQNMSKHLSVFELVALGRQPYTNWFGTLTENDINIINQAITITNLEPLKHTKCFQLSDGQLQLVMIARALAQDTALIILDEPTTHLDFQHKAMVLKLLKSLVINHNKTILYATHDIELALQLCSRIMVLKAQKLYIDTPLVLTQQGVFDTLFSTDFVQFNAETGSFKIK